MKRILIICSLLISVCFAQSKAGFYVVGGKVITVQDNDSKVYLKAIENAGVVPTVTQNFASNYLVTTEKAIGSYSLMTAQYPFIGGTSATHKFNLNNPSGSFNLSFVGGVTHSANGFQPNGTTGYANTFINHSTSLTDGSQGLSIYSRTNYKSSSSSDIAIDIGAGVGSISFFYIAPRFTDENSYYDNRSANISFANSGNSSIGYFLGNTSGGKVQMWKDGFKINEVNKTGVNSGINTTIFLGARNDLGIGARFFSPRQLAYASVNSGLTDTQAIKQSRIVTFTQSLLGRQ